MNINASAQVFYIRVWAQRLAARSGNLFDEMFGICHNDYAIRKTAEAAARRFEEFSSELS